MRRHWVERPVFARVRAADGDSQDDSQGAVHATTVSPMWIGRVMNERRATVWRTSARTSARTRTRTRAGLHADRGPGSGGGHCRCNSVHTTSPNPGTTMPGKQDMYVVVTNGTWDLVGFVPTITGVSAAGGNFRVTPSASVLHNRAADGTRQRRRFDHADVRHHGTADGYGPRTPTYEAFDTAGNAWMSVHGTGFNGSVIEYTPPSSRRSVTRFRRRSASAACSIPRDWRSTTPATCGCSTRRPIGCRVSRPTSSRKRDRRFRPRVMSLAALNTGGGRTPPLVLALDAAGDFWISANILNRPSSPSGDSLPAFEIVKFTARRSRPAVRRRR